MRQRRIFRPAPPPLPPLGALAVGCGLIGAVALLAVALPRELMGSAPAEQRWTAAAQDVMVVDADTLRLGGRVLRLSGIAVPERGAARCGAEDCAAGAADALARLVRSRAVECLVRGRDRQGRALGRCEAGGVILDRALARAGWALVQPADASLEAAARNAGRGLFTPDATPPEIWRPKS
ncbi:thermonuclease family protein [Belnapia sp. F-4-1]|uniref:thermonuclease family protein n=1 Tax=Belnapia sp. F-4-1 TaxID=1545443 RepID=UPI001184E374|nr:thermonuclease family protein [Belnapia sp. F-4-1]